MSAQHGKNEILDCLARMAVGVLNTLDRETEDIRSRVMYYGFDDTFNCYFMSLAGSPKIDQVISAPRVSMMIFGFEDPYDQSWEIEINGAAKLLESPEDIAFALEALKGRNPFADVAIESGISSQFSCFRLKTEVVRYRLYGEALKGNPPTVLEI